MSEETKVTVEQSEVVQITPQTLTHEDIEPITLAQLICNSCQSKQLLFLGFDGKNGLNFICNGCGEIIRLVPVNPIENSKVQRSAEVKYCG